MRPRKLRPVQERFEEKFRQASRDECWNWHASRDRDGYGHFDKTRAHRVSYQLYVGPIPDGMAVCHRCDNPSCVNPAHLFLGTLAENNADRNRKGRQSRGIDHATIRSRACTTKKLSDDQVREIRRRYSSGAPGCRSVDLAREFGVSYVHIIHIAQRKRRALVQEEDAV